MDPLKYFDKNNAGESRMDTQITSKPKIKMA